MEITDGWCYNCDRPVSPEQQEEDFYCPSCFGLDEVGKI